MDWAKATAKRDKKDLSFGIFAFYIRDLTVIVFINNSTPAVAAEQPTMEAHATTVPRAIFHFRLCMYHFIFQVFIYWQAL